MLKILLKIENRRHRICCRQLSENSPSKRTRTKTTATTTTTTGIDSDGDGPKSFDEFITQRRLEAKRSILVQVPSDKTTRAVMKYCTEFGSISRSFFYRNKFQANYFLVEFKSNFAAHALLRDVARSQSSEIAMKTFNSFLVFSSNKDLLKDTESNKMMVQHQSIDAVDLAAIVWRQRSLNELVLQLYEKTRLNDLAIRLRFLAALQIEATVSCIFPSAKALPFGSSVNGFGRMGSDLDVVLSFEEKNVDNKLPLRMNWKAQNGTERSHHSLILQTLSRLMENWTPGVVNMEAILHAKVPIIKYKQSFLDLDVDLSANNLSGVYMSELMHLFGEIDARVRPLCFFVRRWANEWKITRIIRPGPWISNFTLTCLVLFFLQQLKQPILPSIDELKRQARNSDKRPITDDIDCIFLRDISLLSFKTTNTDTLEELIQQFFVFFTNFDFRIVKISLNAGHTLPISDATKNPMHIINPLEPERNISMNVSLQETFNFQLKSKQASNSFQNLRSEPQPSKFVQFFDHKESNDMHRNIISRMNAGIQDTLGPRAPKNKRLTGQRTRQTVRSLTKLT